MNIQVLSDLHLEHQRDYGTALIKSLDFAGADVVVLAGDIVCFGAVAVIAMDKLIALCAKTAGTVLYIPGNHEYYGATPAFVDQCLLSLEQRTKNLKVLRSGQVYEQQSQRILGDTLWFPDDPLNAVYAPGMSDFSVIRNFVPWVYERHNACRSFFDKEMRPGDIVVTHHLPSPRVIASQYTNSPLNRFFVSDLTDLICERKPALWICGHTHASIDTVLCNTRIVCNPRGYPNEGQTVRFNERLVVGSLV